MQNIKTWVKSVLPAGFVKTLRPLYHGCLAKAASWYYGRPSSRMIVVGITGTAGKSTTVKMLAHILNTRGRKTGFITTVSFSDGTREHINKHGLSMPGGPTLQKQLKQMRDSGCQVAVVECTSEGLAQNRHWGIGFQLAIFTNLSPAHIEAHGSFENYRQSKGKLFRSLNINHKSKILNLKSTIVVNLDDPNADFFLEFTADKKIGVTQDEVKKLLKLSEVLLISEARTENGLSFSLEHQVFALKVLGEFNILNASLAAAAAKALGVPLADSASALASFSGALGRMQEIPNPLGLKIIVDYAPEPAAMLAALKSVSGLPHKKIIHVFGSTGGHRDVKKRFEFGEISAAYADEIVITNDDVYDSDPEKIAEDILSAIKKSKRYTLNAVRSQTILDRRQAIQYALNSAQPGDTVLLTGKGSEQFLVLPGNKRIDWDEAAVVHKLVASIK
jgi:UDP-N-acetylmuramoyl-L-alanyl-D-glutamate--2,6-diaminopimelate ligase